ncbi:MAG TPA: ATP-binding protein, partial [Aggregatilineales bacterium]|nr:ATP-binding protein [Aggregatilineales bacterium]
VPLPEENIAIRESFLQSAQFIGRKDEFSQLKTAFDHAQAGQGAVWLVGGESGVGKTRLVDELRILALTRGVTVLRGQAVETGALPYQVWRDILPKLLLNTPVDDQEASILKPLVPDIEALLGQTIPDAPEVEPKIAQQRLLRTILSLI